MPIQKKRSSAPASSQTSTSQADAPQTEVMGNAAALQQMQNGSRGVSGGGGRSRASNRKTLHGWATETLRNKFRIVGPGAQRTAENQVTKEEFDQIAQTFADIYAGKSDIEFDLEGMTEARKKSFKLGAMGDIAAILQTATGRELIDSLHNAPSRGFLQGDIKTTITQHGGGEGDPSNAMGGGQPGKSGTVAYVPTKMHGPDKNLRSDVVLYHEMVHAQHSVYNTWDSNTVDMESGATLTDAQGGVGAFEYQAVGLGEHGKDRFSENKYRRQRRRIGAANTGEVRGDDHMVRRDTYLGFDD